MGLTGFSQVYSQYKKTLHSDAIDSHIHILPYCIESAENTVKHIFLYH